jgi:hypothetical protein
MRLTDYKKDENAESKYEAGILTVALPSWSAFEGEIEKFQKHGKLIWRGQKRRPDWKLLSTFDRDFRELGRQKREKTLAKHLRQWKGVVTGQCSPNGEEWSDNKYWALGQHHGLKTPLLDWTDSPFVAAYFAIRDEDMGNTHRVVYGLSISLRRLIRKMKRSGNTISKDRFVEFLGPEYNDNLRLIRQKARFTKALDGQDVETNVAKYARHRGNNIVLIKIEIPGNWRDECMRSLDVMSINKKALFPDIGKLAECCNHRLEN